MGRRNLFPPRAPLQNVAECHATVVITTKSFKIKTGSGLSTSVVNKDHTDKDQDLTDKDKDKDKDLTDKDKDKDLTQ